MVLRTSWPCGSEETTTLCHFYSGMEKMRCTCLKRRKSAVLESALLRNPISWKPPRAMKCLWKGDTASHLPDAARSTSSIGGRQLNPEGSREKTEYQNWSNWACSPPPEDRKERDEEEREEEKAKESFRIERRRRGGHGAKNRATVSKPTSLIFSESFYSVPRARTCRPWAVPFSALCTPAGHRRALKFTFLSEMPVRRTTKKIRIFEIIFQHFRKYLRNSDKISSNSEQNSMIFFRKWVN